MSSDPGSIAPPPPPASAPHGPVPRLELPALGRLFLEVLHGPLDQARAAGLAGRARTPRPEHLIRLALDRDRPVAEAISVLL